MRVSYQHVPESSCNLGRENELKAKIEEYTIFARSKTSEHRSKSGKGKKLESVLQYITLVIPTPSC